MPGNRSYNYPTQSPGGEGDITGLAATAPLSVTDSGGPVPTVALTGIVPQANGGLGVNASALADGVLVKSGGVMSSTPTLPTANGGTGASSYTANGVVVADGAGTALQSTNAPTTPGQFLLWDGAQWLPGIQTGTVYYFRRDASDIGGGYEQITQSPQTGAEKTDSTTLNNASGTVIFDLYATNAGEPGLTQLLAGTWEFDIYGQVSSTAGGNTTNLVLQFYKRTTGGTETLLFSTTSPALDSTSVKLYSWLYTQPADILLDITDRLVVKVAATNSSVSNRTVTFYYEGTTHYSHFHPPFLSLIDGNALVTIGGTQTITGAKTFSLPPVMSGASITDATIANTKITGATLGRVLADNGTNAQWVPAGTLNYLFFSNGGSSLPAWTNTLVGINIDGSTNTVYNLTTASLATGFNLAATQGGTGQTSYTVGDVLYASTTTALSKLAAGTSGYVWTSNGAGVAPSYQALPTGTTVSTTLTGTTWTSTTFVDTGQKITLPSGGLWLITFKVRNYCQVISGAPGVNTFELYDNTAAAVITDSQAFGAADYIGGGSGFGTTTTWSVIIDVASGRDIKLYVKRLAGPTYAASGTGMASDTTEGTSTATAVLLRS